MGPARSVFRCPEPPPPPQENHLRRHLPSNCLLQNHFSSQPSQLAPKLCLKRSKLPSRDLQDAKIPFQTSKSSLKTLKNHLKNQNVQYDLFVCARNRLPIKTSKKHRKNQGFSMLLKDRPYKTNLYFSTTCRQKHVKKQGVANKPLQRAPEASQNAPKTSRDDPR